MRRWLLLTTLTLTAAACQDQPTTTAPAQPLSLSVSGATMDPALSEALATASATDQLIVIANFDEAVTTRDAVSSELLALGAGVLEFGHLPMVAALATPTQIAEMQSVAGITGLFANEAIEYHMAEAVGSVRADEVQAMGVTGKGVGVAIMDSGIDGLYAKDVEYPERTIQNVKMVADSKEWFEFEKRDTTTGLKTPPTLYKGYELFQENLANTDNSSGHGTHVAGIAAGNGASSKGTYKGIAPGANLIGIGVGDGLHILNSLMGYDWLLENHRKYNIQVVNNSWGSQGEFNPTHPINVATRETHKRGVTVVFSAGNCGMGNGKGGSVTCRSSSIANQLNRYSVAPWVISVAAGCKLVGDTAHWQTRCSDLLGQNRERTLATFSSRGIPGDTLYHPDITATGVYIVSTRASTGLVLNALDLRDDPTTCRISADYVAYYTCASGTSMSAPVVTGIIALMEEAAQGKLTPDEALAALRATARPMPGFGEYEAGAGYADAYRAVMAVKK